ncbi:MAG: hypothetical protein KIT48_11275 [Pseudolabrys sp.]|nr:hypothetical protein [Pseudolabrys sp.]
MASVHGFNQALAKVRGVPAATIEAYSRALRSKGVLPKTRRGGGGPFASVMAGYMLSAVLRGSPSAAAENAREVGDLVIYDGGVTFLKPLHDATLEMFGWADDLTFAQMIGWLIDRHVDGTIGQFIDVEKGYRIEVDRYWTKATLKCHPAAPLLDKHLDGWRKFLALSGVPESDISASLPDRNPDGSLRRPMEVNFHTPILHEVKVSYGVDRERNRNAWRQFRELKDERQGDRYGSESVTQKTLMAVAEVFK